MKKIIEYTWGDGERLDGWLKENFPYMSRGEITLLISEGRVRLNGKIAVKGSKLFKGDAIELDSFPEGTESVLLPDNSVKLKVLYQDENIVVVDKPRGIPSHPNRSGEKGTVANALCSMIPGFAGIGPNKLEEGSQTGSTTTPPG